jgi:hypothetical protein
MEFSPGNHIVKRCLHGMDTEEKGEPEEASRLYRCYQDLGDIVGEVTDWAGISNRFNGQIAAM